MLSVSRRFRASAVLTVFLCLQFAVPVSHADEESPAADEPTDYELMRLFVETYQQVETNYVRDVDRRELMEAAIQGMLKHLDQYSSFIPPKDYRRFNQMVEQEFGGIGITVNLNRGTGELIVVSPLPGTPAHRGGIRAGDRIVKIGGKSTDGMRLTDAVKQLQGPVGRPVSITVVQAVAGAKPRKVDLVRQLIKAPTVRGDRYTEDGSWDFTLESHPDIGYVRLSHFSRYTAEEVKAAVDELVDRKIRGLVIDLRRNPGGLLDSAIRIADMFLEKGNIVSVRGRNVANRSWEAKKSETYPQFPMAVLVSRYSASASEVLSACLQDNKRAVVVGERTWGKGSVQNVIRMEGGDSALKLTTASYHRPSGMNIHRFPEMKDSEQWGVTPDKGFLLKYSTKDWRDWDAYRSNRDVLRAGSEETSTTEDVTFEDRQLVAAVDYLRRQINDEGEPAESDVKESVEPASEDEN